MKVDELRRLVRQHLLEEQKKLGQSRITALFLEEIDRVYTEILNAHRHLDQKHDLSEKEPPGMKTFSGFTSH